MHVPSCAAHEYIPEQDGCTCKHLETEESLQCLRQTDLLMTPEAYRQECASEMLRVINDPLLDGNALEFLTGESQPRGCFV